MDDIIVKGAKEHNLCGVDLTLPRNMLICFSGVSGSGKSSFAFDTLYAEGQRRYIESLSSYARQFLDQLPKPDLETISGLSPAISISQKTGGHNSRSTVGTVTEIYDYLRVLFARVATAYCPECGRLITAQTKDQILDQLNAFPAGSAVTILAPVIRSQKGEYRSLFVELKKQGYLRARVDKKIYRLEEIPRLDRRTKHNIEVVIDRIVLSENIFGRLSESVELALKIGEGLLIAYIELPEGYENFSLSSVKQKVSAQSPGDKSSSMDASGTNLSAINPLAEGESAGAVSPQSTFQTSPDKKNEDLSFGDPASKEAPSEELTSGELLAAVGGDLSDSDSDFILSALKNGSGAKDENDSSSGSDDDSEAENDLDDDIIDIKPIRKSSVASGRKKKDLPKQEPLKKEPPQAVFEEDKRGFSDKHLETASFAADNEDLLNTDFGDLSDDDFKKLSQSEEYIDDENGEISEEASFGGEFSADGENESENPEQEALNIREIPFSTEYACPHCNRSFESPSPQIFSFNSPRGMCPHCQGLGFIHTFDPDLLIPDKTRSFQQGAIVPLGKWKELGRWKRHIYQGVADTLTRIYNLEKDSILETAWEELDPKIQHAFLWGTGDLHITYTWRSGPSGHKWGGKFEGIIPKMLKQYNETENKMFRAMMEKYMNTIPCGWCHGKRINEQASAFKLTTLSNAPRFRYQKEFTLPELCDLFVSDLLDFFSGLQLSETGTIIASELVREIRVRLGFLVNVGLEYLSLGRGAPTLSGGEMQRIRLAGQIGSGLTGVLYVLDEPSIGLHQRDNDRLIKTLGCLRDLGNTVVVVEHDEDTMLASDYLVDFGPGPGFHGGQIVAQGPVKEVFRKKYPLSLTRQYLLGEERIACPEERKKPGDKKLIVRNAVHNNLKGIDVEFPLGLFICVTGVSGSGKSSLVNDIIVEALMRDLNHGNGNPGKHDRIEGVDFLDKLIAIDQTPIGRTPRSNPSTYTKLFDDIRKLFSELPDSKAKGFKPGRFSFNVPGGRCETCEGNGAQKLEMDFLADIWITCPECGGKRFNKDTLSVQFKGKSIDQILDMDVESALELFDNIPKIKQKLQTLSEVGLGYMKLGQPSPTLSGGEAQRIKLAKELVKKSTGKTLYLLDEPTTGLHFADIKLLLKVLRDFVDAGNTVLVVEHNLDVIKVADWVIDLGPEGGDRGGYVIAQGTPEEIMKAPNSYTGQALKKFMAHEKLTARQRKNEANKKAERREAPQSENAIIAKDVQEHNLKNISAVIPHGKMTVCCGPSGSGKSSFAIDTIYAEGQRRYVESLSSYARQFLGQMPKPKAGPITGIAPAIAIDQKAAGHSPRSTVGTVTEIHDYLRVLFARLGVPWCPDCDVPIGSQSIDEVIARILLYPDDSRLLIAAPILCETGTDFSKLWSRFLALGFTRVRVDGLICSLDSPPEIDGKLHHQIEIVVDRIHLHAGEDRNKMRGRVADSVETALGLNQGTIHLIRAAIDLPEDQWQTDVLSRHLSCEKCGRGFEPFTPHHFSFNSPLGWCPYCEGLGVQRGTGTSHLIHDSKLTLEQGAIVFWPGVEAKNQDKTNSEVQNSKAMLRAFCRSTGIPLNVPFEQLDVRFRRTVFHGTGERWIPVFESDFKESISAKASRKPKENDRILFQFQYKGLYPAIEEAGRLVPMFRGRLEYQIEEVECTVCLGSRLRDDVSAVRLNGLTMDQICRKPLADLLDFFNAWKTNEMEKAVAGDLIREVQQRLLFLVGVGLGYLTLSRPAPSLSGGESQRIRLAAQIGSGLVGVLYVLDEPTIGLHPHDNARLIETLKKLCALGNTLLLVEHDKAVIESADHLIDFGPKAGREGGFIVAAGTPAEIAADENSVTGGYLSGRKKIPIPVNRRILCELDLLLPRSGKLRGVELPKNEISRRRLFALNQKKHVLSPIELQYNGELPYWEPGWLLLLGARHNNLKSIDVPIPLSSFVAVTGVSGSGKSSLINDILYRELARKLNRATTVPGAFDELLGMEQINKVIEVDQNPLGQTPTSNPATYTGVFDLIRQLYAQLPESKLRGYTPRRFSFNLPGGRCEKCEGAGQIKIEMHFLADVWVTCDVCGGKRYDQQTLEVLYRGKSIADVLNMTCREALALFVNVPAIARILRMLCEVGLDYITLGQSAITLSGGEAQRVKLAAELARPDTGRTVYILDEPTTGLHFDDLKKLLDVLHHLVDLGNTVIVIEHNPDIFKSADWIIDIGPDAGFDGGYLTFAGTPEQLAEYTKKWEKASAQNRKDLPRSYTGEFLVPILQNEPYEYRMLYDITAFEEELRKQQVSGLLSEEEAEASQEIMMPWTKDGRIWHTQNRVGRTGTPCRWDGRILAKVIDRIEEFDFFAPTDWDNRTIVEVCAEKKSLGWFLHAITGEEWLLKLKFRTLRGTFNKEDLIEKLNLRPLNEMDDIPLYGTQNRVKVETVGHWQEIELKICTYEEFDRPEFWEFLDTAINQFADFIKKTQVASVDLTPWRTQGEQWHLTPAHCYGGSSKPSWPIEILTKLLTIIRNCAPALVPVWTNKLMVPFNDKEKGRTVCALMTKNCESLGLQINVVKNSIPLGRILNLGYNPEVDGTSPDYDAVHLRFRSFADFDEKNMSAFLQEVLCSDDSSK